MDTAPKPHWQRWAERTTRESIIHTVEVLLDAKAALSDEEFNEMLVDAIIGVAGGDRAQAIATAILQRKGVR